MRISVLVLALAATGASAQLSSTGPFVGACSDDFESYAHYGTSGSLDSLGIMGGCATMLSDPTGSGQVWIYNIPLAGWGLGGHGSATTNSGSQGMGLFQSALPISTTLQFTTAVSRFGGYFAVESDPLGSGVMTLEFYDASSTQIGATQTITSASNAMVWSGWNSTVPIDYIVFGGGVIAPVMDDLQADPVPEPATLVALGAGLAALAARRRK
ncbi:MAG: PEP-CTERM sorting domain-containing protein [Fimbriimonadaceae bacterium]